MRLPRGHHDGLTWNPCHSKSGHDDDLRRTHVQLGGLAPKADSRPGRMLLRSLSCTSAKSKCMMGLAGTRVSDAGFLYPAIVARQRSEDRIALGLGAVAALDLDDVGGDGQNRPQKTVIRIRGSLESSTNAGGSKRRMRQATRRRRPIAGAGRTIGCERFRLQKSCAARGGRRRPYRIGVATRGCWMGGRSWPVTHDTEHLVPVRG